MTANKWIKMLLKDDKMIAGAAVVPKERVRVVTPSVNWALGGGLYRGYATCFYGPEQSGKSLLSMMAIAALHKQDPEALAVVISTEMRLPTQDRQVALGVDPERLIIRQANTIHDVFDWIASPDSSFTNSDGTGGAPGMRYLLQEGAPIKALVIDSIKGLIGPREQAADSAEKEIMGDLSKFLGAAFRSIIETIRKHNIMTILVQQVSMNMNPDEVKYQNKKWIVPSGQALKHFCETMALVERVISKDSKIINEDLKNVSDKSLQTGHTIRVRVEKANLDKPFREAEFKLDYDRGVVELPLEILKMAQGLGVVKHPKNAEGREIMNRWMFESEGGTQEWFGAAKALEAIKADLMLQAEILAACEKV